MSIKEIIAEKLRRLESVPDKFISGVDKVEKTFFRKLLEVLTQLDQKDGKILLNKKNLRLVSEIESTLKKSFLETDYVMLVNSYIGEFNKQGKLSDDYFSKAFPDSAIPAIAKDVLELKKLNASKLLLGANLDVKLINPINTAISQAVDTKAGFTETLNLIQNYVLGNEEVSSKIMQYSKEVVYDTFAVTDRTYTKVVSDSLKAEWFFYSGDTIAGTRPFCDERHNKYYHQTEIQKWASKDWAGKMEGTNQETIFVTAGGYNCRHSVLPVSIFRVPKKDIERNIQNGNYHPTLFEIKELGLAA